ncbi:DUF2303 family protein [Streptomyces sp. NPDC050738]|uniref:DUF2303 family protein n=1 Tax=Streptomyces sp. NPDC050738 TaxID=3154744 RepID=UPI00343B25FC
MTTSRYETTLASNPGGLEAVIDIAMRAGQPAQLETGHVYALVTHSGTVQQIDLTGEQYRDAPKGKLGTTVVRDVDSWLAYFTKHADDSTEVYADVQERTITAVLDAHTANDPRWGKHRLELRLRTTTAWEAWTKIDGTYLKQDAFAEFLEDNFGDLVEPDQATMLEIAESFQATTKADFKSGTKLSSGQRTLSYVEDVQATAGSRGDIVIPTILKLGLRPFEGADPFEATARFRYRLSQNGLTLGIKIERPEDILAQAFDDVRTAIAAIVTVPVLNGAPIRQAASF